MPLLPLITCDLHMYFSNFLDMYINLYNRLG